MLTPPKAAYVSLIRLSQVSLAVENTERCSLTPLLIRQDCKEGDGIPLLLSGMLNSTGCSFHFPSLPSLALSLYLDVAVY